MASTTTGNKKATRFVIPTSLGEYLHSSSNRMSGDQQNGNQKTNGDTPKDVKESFPKEKQDPLKNSAQNEYKGGITFAHQEKLKYLPIPKLEATVQKYLDALAPLQTAREHAETQAAAREFLETDGKELQERLIKYAEGKNSYIEEFWSESYLNYESSVVLNLNPFFLLTDDPTPARNNQVTRAASLVISALCFVRSVRKEELPPDQVRGTPLDMYQYSRMFGTARIPTDNGCVVGQDTDSQHIVVMCRGQIYWFDVLDSNSDLIMTENDVAQNLQSIVEDANEIPIQEAAKGAVGVLTTENRKIWSGLRDFLTRDEESNNAECLNIVDSALFVVCLDYTEPVDVSQLCGNMLCGTNEVVKGVQVGTCTNRWYDKLQIIVCQNGSAGINFEHTSVDGHSVLRFASDIYTDTILRFARSINGQAPVLWASNSPDPSKRDPDSFGDVSTIPHKLEWDMTPELQIALRFAETRLADLINQNEFQILEYQGYGANFIKSMGFSPDAFVQMSYQASYYGLYGRVENTYEPAMTKMYYHGRTEAIRSVTTESVDFVKTFWADNPAQQKVDALRAAAQKHTAITKECSKAQGQDRHLYALYCLWQRKVNEENSVNSNGWSSPTETSDQDSPRHVSPARGQIQHMPALFADPGWEKINTTILSTSNCGNPSLRHFGFGPVSGDGFGIGYIIKDDSISVCVSSKHRQTKRFVDSMETYFNEIRKLLKSAKPSGGATGRGTRAREAEEKANVEPRSKPRGRVVRAESRRQSYAVGVETPVSEQAQADDDDGLGGYGFFDAGMLLQALKKKDLPPGPAEQVAQKRRAVGKKLHLSDY